MGRVLRNYLQDLIVSQEIVNKKRPVTLAEVKSFWELNPVNNEEGAPALGTREWFVEAEKILFTDCFANGQPGSIYFDGLKTDSRLLDVGCGHGFWTRQFIQRGFINVTACDLTLTGVNLTRRSFDVLNFSHKPELTVANAEQLPFKSESFDHVNCQGVIHHTPDTEGCIREFHRLLKPGGSCLITIYHRNWLLQRPGLLKATGPILNKLVSLKGRGRESLLNDPSPDEIVRRYDGHDNPLGKSYTTEQALKLFGPYFHLTDFERHFFPARALPFPIPKMVHRYLHLHYGLMLVLKGTK